MKVVRQQDIWPPDTRAISSFIFGMGLAVAAALPLIGLSLIQTTSIQFGAGAALPILIGLPVVVVVVWRCQIATRAGLLWACVGASIGLMLPFHLVALFTIGTVGFALVLTSLAANAALLVFWCALGWITWPIITRIWPFKLQDGTCCPHCGYCVRGVASRICPECGTAFDHMQLGVSVVEFERLISGSMEVGEPEGVH